MTNWSCFSPRKKTKQKTCFFPPRRVWIDMQACIPVSPSCSASHSSAIVTPPAVGAETSQWVALFLFLLKFKHFWHIKVPHFQLSFNQRTQTFFFFFLVWLQLQKIVNELCTTLIVNFCRFNCFVCFVEVVLVVLVVLVVMGRSQKSRTHKRQRNEWDQ